MAKVYEALGAIGDERVEIAGEYTAKVRSSGGDRTYTVKWNDERTDLRSDDNASKWHKTIGYPIIAVMLKLGMFTYDAHCAYMLRGIPWKRLNDEASRNYDKVIADVLDELRARGEDVARLEREVESIYQQLCRSVPPIHPSAGRSTINSG